MTAQRRLMTAEQLCREFGIPSPRTVRTMRQQGLAAVRLGKAYLFDPADVESFIQARKECHAPTPDRNSHGSPSVAHTTSGGMSAAQSASAARARQISEKLKKRSPSTLRQAIVSPALASHRT